jgi:membrane protein CcdC involved in cytochrome C biogenesis
MATAGIIVALGMAIFWNVYRMKEAAKPVTAKKIILPPFFMSTGAFMYVVPVFRITLAEMVEAVLVGMFFSIFLIITSKFEIRGTEIYLQRSKAFVIIIFGLLAVRIAWKSYLSNSVDYGQLSGMFFLLAFAMIVCWRIAMYFSYKKMEKKVFTMTHPTNI